MLFLVSLLKTVGARQRLKEQERDQEKKKQKRRQGYQKQTSNYDNTYSDNCRFLDRKIDEITAGLCPEYARLLYNTSADNYRVCFVHEDRS